MTGRRKATRRASNDLAVYQQMQAGSARRSSKENPKSSTKHDSITLIPNIRNIPNSVTRFLSNKLFKQLFIYVYIYASIHYQRKKRAEKRRDVKVSWAGAAAWSSGTAEYAGHEQRKLQKPDQHSDLSQGECHMEPKQQSEGLGWPSWAQSSSNYCTAVSPSHRAVGERDFPGKFVTRRVKDHAGPRYINRQYWVKALSSCYTMWNGLQRASKCCGSTAAQEGAKEMSQHCDSHWRTLLNPLPRCLHLQNKEFRLTVHIFIHYLISDAFFRELLGYE